MKKKRNKREKKKIGNKEINNDKIKNKVRHSRNLREKKSD
jgi:hypothetical protein